MQLKGESRNSCTTLCAPFSELLPLCVLTSIFQFPSALFGPLTKKLGIYLHHLPTHLLHLPCSDSPITDQGTWGERKKKSKGWVVELHLLWLDPHFPYLQSLDSFWPSLLLSLPLPTQDCWDDENSDERIREMGAFLSSLWVRNTELLLELCLFVLMPISAFWAAWRPKGFQRGENMKLTTDLVALQILVSFPSLPDFIYSSHSSHSGSMQSIPIQGLEIQRAERMGWNVPTPFYLEPEPSITSYS